jgi:glycosyltransferase involved in cell wall biosynthesis
MQILALEPYYGGSHKAFLDGWSTASEHKWTIFSLAPYKWKWRMRHSAVTFAKQIRELLTEGQSWDLIFCSDMLNLAEFLGMADDTISALPKIVYFHENQLTYPVRFESERDYQFAMTNMTTTLAADSVWFNSAFHRDSFLQALEIFLKKMPDYQPLDAINQITEKAQVHHPGISDIQRQGPRETGPVRILWAARWEHDKRPEDFFEALTILKSKGINFRISVIGEQFRDMPEIFESAHKTFAEHIDRWGFQQSRAEYEHALLEADIVVSTAEHEFFGISVVEAISAGAYPLLPNRLAYPEVLQVANNAGAIEFLYDGTVGNLAEKLENLIGKIVNEHPLPQQLLACELVQRFKWKNLAPVLDKAAEKALDNGSGKENGWD